MTEEFILEVKIGNQNSVDEYSKLIDEILKEFDQKIEESKIFENRDKSIGWTTIGSFTVKNKKSLIDLYKLIESREDDTKPGSIKKGGGGEIYAIDSDTEDIEEAGGDIIGEVGDHLLVEIPTNQITKLLDFDTLKK